MTLDEQISLVQNRLAESVIFTNAFREAYDVIRDIHRHPTFGGQPRSILISGATGTGKSKLQAAYLQNHPWRTEEISTVIPVFSFSIPANAGQQNLMTSILANFGEIYLTTGKPAERMRRIMTLLRNCKTEMIFINEFQHLTDRGGYKSQFRASDWMKEFMEEANVPVVAFGLPRAQRFIDMNDQLRRRFTATHEIRKWDLATRTDKIDFLSFLNQLESVMQLPDSSNLTEPALAERIFYATNGVPGNICRLVASAAKTALEAGCTSITAEHFNKAFATTIWAPPSDREHPFSPEFVPRPLTQAGEPFAPTQS